MNSESDSVAADAEAELRRLEQLEDVAWQHQALILNAPALVKVAVLVLSLAALTGIGLTARTVFGPGDDVNWLASAAVIVISLGYVFVVTRLERHYAPIKVDSLLPPKRVSKKYNKLYAALQVPAWVCVPVFLFAAETARPWYWFAGLALGLMVATWLWSLGLNRLGVVDRLTPSEPTI